MTSLHYSPGLSPRKSNPENWVHRLKTQSVLKIICFSAVPGQAHWTYMQPVDMVSSKSKLEIAEYVKRQVILIRGKKYEDNFSTEILVKLLWNYRYTTDILVVIDFRVASVVKETLSGKMTSEGNLLEGKRVGTRQTLKVTLWFVYLSSVW